MKNKLLFLLSLLILTGAGCINRSNPVTEKTTGNVPASTTVEAETSDISTSYTSTTDTSTTYSIDQNNPDTWPRFTFKELGFSVKLPFSTNSIETGFAECKNGQMFTSSTFIRRVCDDPNHYSYWYNALLHGSIEYIFLGGVSEYYTSGGESTLITLHDFSFKGENILIGQKIIHPLQTVYVDGFRVVIFDANKDFYHDNLDNEEESMYGAVFKLSNDKKFKVVSLQFLSSDLSLKQFVSAIKTIQKLH